MFFQSNFESMTHQTGEAPEEQPSSGGAEGVWAALQSTEETCTEALAVPIGTVEAGGGAASLCRQQTHKERRVQKTVVHQVQGPPLSQVQGPPLSQVQGPPLSLRPLEPL